MIGFVANTLLLAPRKGLANQDLKGGSHTVQDLQELRVVKIDVLGTKLNEGGGSANGSIQ